MPNYSAFNGGIFRSNPSAFPCVSGKNPEHVDKFASGDHAAQGQLFGRMRAAIRLAHSSLWPESLVQSRLLWLFLACKGERSTSKTKQYDKKHRNAAVSHLSHSCWNHYAFSRGDRRCCHGSFGSHNWHFDFGRQVVHRLQAHGGEKDCAPRFRKKLRRAEQRPRCRYRTAGQFTMRRRRPRSATPRC